MRSESNPYASPPPGAPRRQETPGFNPWTWALRHKVAGALAAVTISAMAVPVVATYYGMLLEAPQDDVEAACAAAISAQTGADPTRVTAEYADTEMWSVRGRVLESGQPAVYKCLVSEGLFNRLSVESVTRQR